MHRYEYRWADGVQIKKPIEVSAPKYVEYLMDWIESQLDDESIFPQKLGKMFIGHALNHLQFFVTKCTISSQLQGGRENNIQETVPSIRPHLSLALPEDCEPQGRSPSEHMLQAFHTVYFCKFSSAYLLPKQ
ncbi:hypothetical protein V6N13_021499 [Hibiscus sabdariffa]